MCSLFFFKQKTAYEMRISDWSSDVCSSDLALWRHAVRNALIPVVTIMGLQFSFLLAGTIIIENVFYLPGLGRLVFQATAQRDLVVVKEIGRASCRARVCQYV